MPNSGGGITIEGVTAGGKVLVRLNGRGGFAGGPRSTAGTGGSTATGPTASDITVVP